MAPPASCSSDREDGSARRKIAELSAHLEAATARLLDLIREFDAHGGWNSGFRSHSCRPLFGARVEPSQYQRRRWEPSAWR